MTRRREWKAVRLWRVIRTLLLLFVCLSVGMVALLSSTRARAGDVLVQVGQQLMRLPDARYARGPQPLSINGLSLMTQSGASDLPPHEVVARFRELCRSRAAMQLDESQRSSMQPLLDEGWFRSVLDGVLVERGEAGTAVVCIDALGKPWDVLHIAQAARRFAETGELQELGQLRYAWVREGERGSVFLTFWTHGSASLLRQFPSEQDAPGFDFPGVARVPGSQRYLSARLADSLMVVYRHRGESLADTAERYQSALEAGGYDRLRPTFSPAGQLSFGFEGRQRGVCSIVSRDGQTLVTLISQP